MNVVMIIPTGLGCNIGGHAGDAGAVAKLLASCCDTLITHPNVLNASDINEKTENTWYVDGYLLDEFLRGKVNLAPPKQNKILLAVNYPVMPQTVNSVNAARHTIGAEIEIMPLKAPLTAIAAFNPDGSAGGTICGHSDLIAQALQHEFDALAIQSVIDVSKSVALDYLRNGGVNPWGGIEAILSRCIADGVKRPVAHAPMDSGVFDQFNEVVPSRMAAELVSVSYLHCVLQGLHDAPMPTHRPAGLQRDDIDLLIAPDGCWGSAHTACFAHGIEIVAVNDNRPQSPQPSDPRTTIVENYLEAAGLVMAQRARVSTRSLRSGDY